jgi:PST family polysaccharide transporter
MSIASVPAEVGAPAIELADPKRGESTYGEILKSSAIIGAASAMTLVVGIVRTKAMALLVGPAGVGLLGLYNTIAELTRSVAAMGINGSGVRQIAEAVATGDDVRIARTVTVLRRTTVTLGVIGAVLLALLSRPVTRLTFGTDQHADAVALLSLAVLFRLVADGQGALIQGARRISDLARMSVLGAIFGTAVSIAIVYVLREDGIVPSLVAVAAITAVTSWWYSRRVRIASPTLSMADIRREAGSLLKFGVAFMASGVLMLCAAYAVRMIILRTAGLEAIGLYECAWTLGGIYVGFVLQAMGTDFYPRLVGVATDDAECNRLVNEQTQVSLLLAGPGVLATLTFAPYVIEILYSPRFAGAVDVLRWLCLGMTLRVLTWPLGYIIVAKGRQTLFLCVEIAWTVISIGLAWPCVEAFGLSGAGIAFFGAYVFHGVIVYPLVRALSGFRWSAANIRAGLLLASLIGLVSVSFYTSTPRAALTIGVIATVANTLYATWVVLRLVPEGPIHRAIEAIEGLSVVRVWLRASRKDRRW